MSDDHQLKHTAYHEVGHAAAVLLLGGTVRELHIESGNGNLGETDFDLEGDCNNAIMILASFVAQCFYEPDYPFNVPEGAEGLRIDCWMLHGHLKPDDANSDYGRLKSCLLRMAQQQHGVKAESLTNEAATALVAPIFDSLMQEANDLLAPHEKGVHQAAALLIENKRLTGVQFKQALCLV